MNADPPRIPTIGLLGGVASGKSTVAGCFARLGCVVIDGDLFGHQVLAQPEVIAAARERWGDAVVKHSDLDRRAIAQRVFGAEATCSADLAFWEGVTHPRISELLADEIWRLRDNAVHHGAVHKGIVLDAAVMLKAGWQKQCDFLVFVDAPEEVRIKRAIDRGWTAEQLRQREAAQTSVQEKRHVADFVVDNSGDLEQTYEEVVKVWHTLSR